MSLKDELKALKQRLESGRPAEMCSSLFVPRRWMSATTSCRTRLSEVIGSIRWTRLSTVAIDQS